MQVQFLELHDNNGEYICDYDPHIEVNPNNGGLRNEIFEEVKRNRFMDPDMDDEVENRAKRSSDESCIWYTMYNRDDSCSLVVDN
eukprot:830919-Amorphochlora_amoeboformis.AAC.1